METQPVRVRRDIENNEEKEEDTKVEDVAVTEDPPPRSTPGFSTPVDSVKDLTSAAPTPGVITGLSCCKFVSNV